MSAPRLYKMWSRSLVATALLCAVSAPVQAQLVHGRVTDDATDRPVPNSVVRLLNAAGEARAATTTDSLGIYRVAVPSLGAWTLRVEQLGYDAAVSREVQISEPTDTVAVYLSLRPTPIPIRGLEVSADRVDQRLRAFLGTNPSLLRVRPVGAATIRDMAMRGGRVSDLVEGQRVPNLRLLPGRTGPCYQHRGRGCLPVYLDGARLTRAPNSSLPLEMLGAVLILTPNELIAYPEGAVLLFTLGFVR